MNEIMFKSVEDAIKFSEAIKCRNRECLISSSGNKDCLPCDIKFFREQGYLGKSELEEQIEAADNAYNEYVNSPGEINAVYSMNKFRLLCERLKKDHPELNK
jgi:hypothetical protein